MVTTGFLNRKTDLMINLQATVDSSRLHNQTYTSIPSQIGQLKAFILYAVLAPKKEGGKWRKQGINPRTGKYADWNNPSDYVTLDQARELLASNSHYHGIGICFKGMPKVGDHYLVCVDLDNVYESGGSIKTHHLELLNGLQGFVETSLSGGGKHVFVLANDPIQDFKSHEHGVEVFSTNGFIALTGNPDAQFSKPLGEQHVDLALLDRYEQNWRRDYDSFAAQSERDPNMSLEELRDLIMSVRPPDAGRGNWIKAGMACHHQAGGDLEGLDIWHDWSAQGYEHPEIYGEPATYSDMEYQWHSFKKYPVQGRSLTTHKTLRYWANLGSRCDKSIFEELEYDLNESEATEFILDGFIAEGIFVLAGESGIGKTTLLLPLAALAAHICADDHPLKPILRRPVLYLTEDRKQAVRIVSGLRKHCGVTKGEAEINRWLKIRETHRMNKEEISKLICQFAEENKQYMKDVNGNDVLIPVLIVCDTAAASLDLDDENNNSEVSKYISAIKLACSETGASLWVVAHISKALNRAEIESMSARGASAFGADANGTGFVIKDDKGDESKRFLVLKKKRYEADLNEVSFTTERHELFVKNRLGQTLPESYRIGSIEKSSEQGRKESSQQLQLGREERRVLDAMIQSGHNYFPKTLIAALTGNPTGNGYQKLLSTLAKLVADGKLEIVTAKEAIADGANVAPNAREVYRATRGPNFEV